MQVGRPRARPWIDDIVSVVGHTWMRLALNCREFQEQLVAHTRKGGLMMVHYNKLCLKK